MCPECCGVGLDDSAGGFPALDQAVGGVAAEAEEAGGGAASRRSRDLSVYGWGYMDNAFFARRFRASSRPDREPGDSRADGRSDAWQGIYDGR